MRIWGKCTWLEQSNGKFFLFFPFPQFFIFRYLSLEGNSNHSFFGWRFFFSAGGGHRVLLRATIDGQPANAQVQQHCVRCVKVDREHVPRTHLKTWEGSHRKLLQKNVLSGAIFLLLLLLPRLKDLLGRVGWGDSYNNPTPPPTVSFPWYYIGNPRVFYAILQAVILFILIFFFFFYCAHIRRWISFVCVFIEEKMVTTATTAIIT